MQMESVKIMPREAFKKTQVLPLLPAAMISGHGRAAMPYGVLRQAEAQPARSHAVPTEASKSLPAAIAMKCAAGQTGFGLMVLCAAAGYGQMWVLVIGLSANALLLNACTAHVVG